MDDIKKYCLHTVLLLSCLDIFVRIFEYYYVIKMKNIKFLYYLNHVVESRDSMSTVP